MVVVKYLVVAMLGGLMGAAGVYFFMQQPQPENIKQAEEAQLSPEQQMIEQMQKQQQQFSQQLDSLFGEDFFSQKDPFEAMRQFREQMKKDFEGFEDPSAGSPFDIWFGQKFGGGSIYEVSQREDESFVYYDVIVENAEATSIKTNVENGYLTITGKVEANPVEEDSQLNTFSSSFSRSFPLPPNVDVEAMQMSTEGEKIIIKFPKSASSQ